MARTRKGEVKPGVSSKRRVRVGKLRLNTILFLISIGFVLLFNHLTAPYIGNELEGLTGDTPGIYDDEEDDGVPDLNDYQKEGNEDKFEAVLETAKVVAEQGGNFNMFFMQLKTLTGVEWEDLSAEQQAAISAAFAVEENEEEK